MPKCVVLLCHLKTAGSFCIGKMLMTGRISDGFQVTKCKNT